MSPPRVVHVSPVLFGKGGMIGGGERYVVELARAMAERTPTRLISFGTEPRTEKIGALEVEVLPNWAPWGRFQADPIGPALFGRLKSADVVHCHQTFSVMATAALAWGRMSGRPIFTTNLGGFGDRVHRWLGLQDWHAGHLHISQFSRRVYGHEALATARVILGGVDTERFSPDPAAERTGEVLFVGRLLPHKGINYLVEAVDASTPLTVIGTRWWNGPPAFNDLLETLAAGKQVRFAEDCDDAGLIDAYRRALCVVLPSVYDTVLGQHHNQPELLGQTLLEGMACGIPAICTDVGAMPEVVEDGVTGFVVPPNDAAALGEKIRWLKEHPAEARAMGEAGRRRVLERFAWSKVVDRCLEAYAVA
jgi:glycosyltransferase involved in cell wall biosynthesis